MSRNKISVLQAANLFLDFSDQWRVPLNNLRLQQLLFFAQGFFLLRFDDLMFQDEIQAWDCGPVIPEIYYELKSFGSYEIKSRVSCFIPGMGDACYPSMSCTMINENEIVNNTFALMGGSNGFALEQDICRQDSPWQLAMKSQIIIINVRDNKDYFAKIYAKYKAQYDLWEANNIKKGR